MNNIKVIALISALFFIPQSFAAPPSFSDLIAVGLAVESKPNTTKERNKILTLFYVEHYVGSYNDTHFSIGAGLGALQFKEPNISHEYADLFFGINHLVNENIILKAYGDVGKCYSGTACDFFYYQGRLAFTYRFNKYFSWDVIDYRRRDTFNVDNGFQANLIGTGVRFGITNNQDLYTRFYKIYPEEGEDTNGILFEYRVQF